MDSDDPEKTAFLSSSSDRSKTAGPDSCDTKPSSWRTPFYRLDFALHFLLIVLYTFVAVSFVRSNSSQEQCLHSPNGDDSTIAPQKASAVGSKTENAEVLGITDLIFIPIFKRFTAFQDSPFTGSPGPDSDRAWHDLLSNMSVRVSREELERGNQTSVELPDGGYMAWLGVFHELHCVVGATSEVFCTAETDLSNPNFILEDAPAMEISRLLPPKPDPRGGNAP